MDEAQHVYFLYEGLAQIHGFIVAITAYAEAAYRQEIKHEEISIGLRDSDVVE